MDFLTILLIAAALAMDAFSVSITCGMIIPRPGFGHYFRLSFHFGLFQFMMPIIGYSAGMYLEKYIRAVDHWIAFSLLLLIGLKMIHDAFQKKEEDTECKDPSRGLRLLILAVATSIDALAVGFSIGVLGGSIVLPSIIIGVVCAVFSIIGVALGNHASRYISRGGELIGGIVLILIGVKILIEHMV